MARVLVACERSGVVRSAFRAAGHDAWSNDLMPADDGSAFHIQGDAIHAAYTGAWDLVIAHPECTYLANSGAKHLYAGMNKANGPGLPPLTPTNIVEGREQRVFRMAPGPNRKADRSRTYEGIAQAMAAQWGALLEASRAAA